MNRDFQVDTIIAQATAHGNGALALIRLSGPEALSIASAMSSLHTKKTLLKALSHSIHYGYIVNRSQEVVDQVLFMVMRAPRTFTGEDTVEISCHNNPFIIQAIIEEALLNGARSAEQGEFSKRAVLNKKIDVLQAEAINDLITAQTQFALKKSLSQLNGTLSSWIMELEQQLVKALVYCEASFEFLDEEASFAPVVEDIIQSICTTIIKNKKVFNQQQLLKQGLRIALIGSVNSGKSSLFNALVGYKRAIVTPQAGTTRDTLEASLIRKKANITFIDTAGLRHTDNSIEQEGIQRSFEEAQKADLILLVFDCSRTITEQETSVYNDMIAFYGNKTLLINNKSDLLLGETTDKYNDMPMMRVSALTGYGLENLEGAIDTKIDAIFSSLDSPFLLNKRQYELLITLETKLQVVLAMLKKEPHYELLSYHLRESLENITELTGKTISENGMDAIFKEFCIGK